MTRFQALITALMLLAARLQAQDRPAPTSRPLGAEAFAGIRTFFAYDSTLPLNVRVSEEEKTDAYRREKIVFTGTNGNRVPGYLTIPLGVTERVPLVLALHAGGGSKESWWETDSFEHGQLVTERLLAGKVAILSLDGQFHGERSSGNDFESYVTMYFGGKHFTWIRDGIIQTVRDYRRALDYLATRPELDMTRVGVIGCSFGGLMSVYLTAFERRTAATVVCVAGLDEPWLYPIAPINLASALGRVPILFVGGRTDEIAPAAKTDALLAAIPGSSKRLIYFDTGHRLPETYADSATTWLLARLKK